MTHRDIFLRVLGEATGWGEAKVGEVLDAMASMHPDFGAKLAGRVPEAEAEQLIGELRAELPGIRQWLEDGYRQAKAKMQ